MHKARTRHIDHYADGCHISARRQQKALILAETLQVLFPRQEQLEIVDFGCADGAVLVQLLHTPMGSAIAQITGITRLNYNDLPEKPAFTHPHFHRLIADLQHPLDDLPLPWGRCDAVLATAFFHYLTRPEITLAHAAHLLKPGGVVLAGMPARWVLRLRRHGIPGLLPRNNYIHSILSLDAWAHLAADAGLIEESRQAVQWCGLHATAPLEHWLRRHRLLAGWGSNYLVVYRKQVHGESW